MSTTTIEKEKTSIVPAFMIEIDTSNNSDVLLRSIPNCRLRSAISASKTVLDVQTGDQVIPKDRSNMFGALPKVPGMRIQVNPDKLTYKIVDPLFEDENLCEKIRRNLNNTALTNISKLGGNPPQNGTIEDVHLMKTLCRELFNLLDSKQAKMVKGPEPTKSQIDKLPGRYLYDPNCQLATTQPTFEDEVPEWRNMLARRGE
jgi:hypothetical protein